MADGEYQELAQEHAVADVGGRAKDPDSPKLFVGQVPRTLNEDELRTLLQEFGDVFEVNILRDKLTGTSRGKQGNVEGEGKGGERFAMQ